MAERVTGISRRRDRPAGEGRVRGPPLKCPPNDARERMLVYCFHRSRPKVVGGSKTFAVRTEGACRADRPPSGFGRWRFCAPTSGEAPQRRTRSQNRHSQRLSDRARAPPRPIRGARARATGFWDGGARALGGSLRPDRARAQPRRGFRLGQKKSENFPGAGAPVPRRPARGAKGKRQKANHSIRDSHVVPHHGTNRTVLRLTSQIGRDAVLSKSYGRGY
jgi:hypothetical protein